MIRDIIVLTHSGVPLCYQNFGDCHQFGEDPTVISGFISALQMFSKKLTQSEVKLVQMVDKKIAFHRTKGLLYAIISEENDPIEEIRVKTRKTAEIFENEYSEAIEEFEGNIEPFSGFGDLLVSLNITQKNCGGRPECAGCPNSSKNLPLQQYTKDLEEKASLWTRIKKRLFD